MRRVREGSDGAKRSVEFNYELYKESVFRHLQNMFNTRQGSCMANPTYGLPDFNDLDMKFGFTVAVQETIKAIKENISLHEPGLSSVRVKFVKDETAPLELQFEIIGVLSAAGTSERVRFETKKSSSGILEVH